MSKKRRYHESSSDDQPVSFSLRTLTAKTAKQKEYLEATTKQEMVFSIGPAGAGKTYLAVSCALKALKDRKVERIIITRPIVEAGERLGFLPGDLQEKVNPYLRPIFDAFTSLLGADTFVRLWDSGIIEVAPLAYMRGRTLSNAFVILDEAQNTTQEQMKMFLTRMGEGSRSIITGDITQIDLPTKTQSGLLQAIEILQGVEGISFITFSDEDVVRHELVKRIVKAYDKVKK